MPKATIVLALPLDHAVEDVVEAAIGIATRLDAAVLPVHAAEVGEGGASTVRANGGVRDSLVGWLEPLVKRGITVLDPVIEKGRPERVVALAAARAGATMVLAGSGRGETIRDWALGRTADRLIRGCTVPVLLARGTLPGPDRPVLVPVDLLEESRLAIAAGLRWARLFGAPLRVLHVQSGIDPRDAETALGAIEREEARAREAIEFVLSSLDREGVRVEVSIAHGPVAGSIVRAAESSGLLVVVQPDWGVLVPASIGSRAERIVHASRASVLAIRDDDTARDRALREERARWTATLLKEAEAALAGSDPARAERLLENARVAAPVSPRVEELLARALEEQGRGDEGDRHRALAAWLRGAIG